MNAFVKEIIGFDFYFKHALGRSELHGEEFHDHDEIVFCLCTGVRLVSKKCQARSPDGKHGFNTERAFSSFYLSKRGEIPPLYFAF